MPPPAGIRVKKARTQAPAEPLLHSFNLLSIGAFGGTNEEAYMRYRLYNSIWETVRWKIQAMQHNENLPIVDQVCEFLRTFEQNESRPHRYTIPVASVVTGIVRGENTLLFNVIRQKLQCTMKPYFARIDTTTKPTLKMILQSIMEQLNKQDFNVAVTSCSVSSDQQQNLSDCYKKNPVVIIIEDVEQLDNVVLQDLLRLICSGHYKAYSVQLILGSPHGFHSWQDVIPQEIESSYLHQEFCEGTSERRLENFWNIILHHTIPVKLSGSVVKYLQEYYTQNNSSISRLLQLYNLCVMKHFMEKQCTLLCMEPDLLQKIRSDPNSLTFEHKPDLHMDDDAKAEEVMKYHNQARLWTAIVHCLFELSKGLPCNPLGTSLADVYVRAWDKDMFTSDPRLTGNDGTPFQKFVDQLSYVPYPDLKLRLQNAMETLNKYKSADEANEADTRITELCQNLQNLVAFKNLAKSPDRKPSSPSRPGLRDVSAAQFQAQKQAHLQKAASKANNFLSKVKEFLRKLKELLVPLHKAPRSEAFIFENLDWLKEIAAPHSRKNLHNDILSTHIMPGEEEPILLDSTCLYQVVTEQSVVNMKVDDLFQAFSSMQESTAAPDEDETDEEHMLFRMRQAAIELEILGIFKSNKRSSDLLTRQIWHFDH